MSFKIELDHLTIEITKLDTGEYEFATIYQYLEYWGKSFIKSLSFVEDFQEYFSSVFDKCSIDYFDKYIILTFPVPFSSKYELVQLNKPDMDEIQELKILIKKQEEIIQKLNCRLTIHDKTAEHEQNKMATLDFTYDAKGWNLDIDGYLAKPNSNKHNLDYLLQIINDSLGFTSKKQSNNTYQYACPAYGGNGICNIPDVYNDFNSMIECMHKPAFIYPGLQHNIGWDAYNSPYILTGVNYAHNQCFNRIKINHIDEYSKLLYQLKLSNVQDYRIYPYFNIQHPYKYPFQHLYELFGKKLVVIQYEIPYQDIIYKRVPYVLDSNNNYIEDVKEINKDIIKLIKKHGLSKQIPQIIKVDSLATYILY